MRGWKKYIKKIKNESGAAMIWALIVLLVVSIASASIFAIQHADIKEVMLLENHYTAYYASLGGMELGLAALMTDYNPGSGTNLFDKYVKSPSSLPEVLSHNYEYKNDSNMVVATVSIEVYKQNLLGKDWVIIKAEGTDINSGHVAVNYMRINVNDKLEVRRDGDRLPE